MRRSRTNDSTNPQLEYSPSNFDVPQRFNQLGIGASNFFAHQSIHLLYVAAAGLNKCTLC
jgi:hypothetical protein